MIRDFGPEANLDWTASESEGAYEIEVAVRNTSTGDSAMTSSFLQITPIATGDAPVISAISNPLVLLYSAPACAPGGRMRVLFQDPGGAVRMTPFKPCQVNLTMNFYLAGMLPDTQYTMRHTIIAGSSFQQGPVLRASTGSAPGSLAAYNIIQPQTRPVSEGVLLQSTLAQPSVATDLAGNLIWYYAGNISFLTRPEPGGRFLGIFEDGTVDLAHQFVREFDVAGNTLQETNAARVNEQLAALNKRPISGFHHEASRLPDGNLMVLADEEQTLTDVQGSGPVDVIGDMILILNPNLEVIWTWDAFDHLDTSRMATLNETCQLGGGGCPPFYQAQTANDWLHGNSLQLTPDGNILYSARHQDWVIKIDYANGTGSGNVIWRLGKDGDFQYASDDPYPWFSHQHDPGIDFGVAGRLVVFDDGNLRYVNDATAHSRGQVLQLDENNRTARLVVNADLGAYSYALGSAHWLSNGNYHFDLGWIQSETGGLGTSRSVEVDASGAIVYDLEVMTPEYRSFRMQSLYTPEPIR